MEKGGTTVATPFVFLRPKNRKDICTKKAVMTPTVASLIKVACKIFKNYGTVKAIYTENGELVRNISQVIPSATYYVSTIEPDLQEIKPNDDEKTQQPKKEQQPAQQKQKKPSAFNKLFGNETTFSAELRKKLEEERRKEEEEKRRKEEEERRIKEEEERRIRE